MKSLDTIIAELERAGTITPGVRRPQRWRVDMTRAMAMLERIGQRRLPRFRIDTHNRWTFVQLLKWLYGDPSMLALDPDAAARKELRTVPGNLSAGLYIAGPTGTGKSWALELLNVMAAIDCPRVELAGISMPISYTPVRADEIWDAAATDDTALERYMRTPLLCIQDLGAEPEAAAVRMGTRRDPLRQILESRGDRTDRLTFITSNLGMCSAEMEQRYTQRVVSRLRGMCNFLIINGPDRRAL